MGNRAGARFVATGETPFGFSEKASFAGLTHDYGLSEFFRAIEKRPDIVAVVGGFIERSVAGFNIGGCYCGKARSYRHVASG